MTKANKNQIKCEADEGSEKDRKIAKKKFS